MDKERIMKIVGVGATIVGGALLYLSGSGEDMALELIGGVFLLAAVVSSFFNRK